MPITNAASTTARPIDRGTPASPSLENETAASTAATSRSETNAAAAGQGEVRDAVEQPLPAGRRAFNPVLALLNRFGTVAPMSDAQRETDLVYRAERADALAASFPGLVQSQAPFDTLIQQAHGTLNVGKKFSMVVRLSSLLIGNNLQKEGHFRSGPNRAGPFVAPAARDVEPLMRAFGGAMGRLIDDAKANNDDAGARLAAAWALTVMIRIHPFMDGNGRTARAAMNLTLAKAGQQTIDFPSDSEGVYKKSLVWRGLKDHMRGFVGPGGVGWSMDDGMVPPVGYFEKLKNLLADEIDSTTLTSLAGRADVAAIADALAHVRQHGF